MIPLVARANHLRARHSLEHSRVTFVELFFDLVFVFAVTQLSHGLLEHLTPLGALQTAALMQLGRSGFMLWAAWPWRRCDERLDGLRRSECK